MDRLYARRIGSKWTQWAIGRFRLALVLPIGGLMLFAHFFTQNFGGEDFNCRAVLGNIQQQLAVGGGAPINSSPQTPPPISR